MSDHHASDYAKGEVYEGDMEGSSATVLIGWIVVLTAVFFATVFALVVYFRWERDFVNEVKVSTFESADLAKLRAEEAKWLSAVGIPEGGQGMDVNTAKALVVTELGGK